MSVRSALRVVPVRYTVSVMIFFGMLFNYMVRVNINLAIVAMVNHTALPHTNVSRSDECGAGGGGAEPPEPQTDGPFVWDERVQGLVLGAFYYGYAATQLAGGRAAEVFSGKHTFGVAMLLAALLTMLTPAAASSDWRLLVAVRAAMGLVLGVTYPASYVLLVAWVPLGQMNFLVMLAQGGGDLGTTFTLPMTSAIIEALGWEAVFYIQAGFVLVWFAAWLVLVSEGPDDHWFITDEERRLIAAGVGPRVSAGRRRLPWRAVLTSRPVWAYFIGYFGACWCYYSLLTDLPQYFSTMLGEDLSSNALFNSLPYLGLWLFTLSFGYVSDMVMARGWAGALAVRRTAAAVSILGPAALLAVIAFAGCQTTLVETLLVVTIVLQGAGYSLGVLPLELAPNFAGTLAGLANTLGSVPGFLGPLVVAALTEGNETLARWRVCFLIAAGLAAGCGALLIAGCSVEEQPWNRTAPEAAGEAARPGSEGKRSLQTQPQELTRKASKNTESAVVQANERDRF